MNQKQFREENAVQAKVIDTIARGDKDNYPKVITAFGGDMRDCLKAIESANDQVLTDDVLMWELGVKRNSNPMDLIEERG